MTRITASNHSQFDKEVKLLIDKVDNRYDEWVRDFKLHESLHAHPGIIASYQKNFLLTSLFGREYTGPTQDATRRLQEVYEHLQSYVVAQGDIGVQFQLLLIYQSQHRIRGFDLFLHFNQRALPSTVAALILYQMQYLIADRYDDKTVLNRHMQIAFEDLPNEKEKISY